MLTMLHKKATIVLLLLSTNTVCGKKPTPIFSQEKNNIKISAHLLTKADMRRLFNCYNPIKIVRLTNHYKAIEITIENKTAQDYVLDQNNISIKTENTLIIREKIKTNPVLLPLSIGIGMATLLISGIGFAVVPSLIAATTIGATALNLNMQKSNKISTKNIRAKVLDAHHPALIPSYSKTQKIIFTTAKSHQSRFTLSIESLDSTQKIVFDVAL